MSTATHLGDRGGQRHVCKQAEAGGACSSEHCSCWSHAELCPSILRGVHPWDPLAQSKRPSLVVTWLLCANAAGRCHERLGGTSGNPPATAAAIAERRSRSSFYYFTEVVMKHMAQLPRRVSLSRQWRVVSFGFSESS